MGRKKWDGQPYTFEVDTEELIQGGDNTIAVRITAEWNNNIVINNVEPMQLWTDKVDVDLSGTWKYSESVEGEFPIARRYYQEPAFLYNAMIHPIAGYSINGVIWYQGEDNADESQHYNTLFEAMIEEWRSVWNQGDFLFLFVQLANFMNRYDEPTDSDWARLREAQTQTLSLANTRMATIIDIGDAADIHPRNKKEVGDRLWLAARNAAYGENLVYSGPMYAGHTIQENKVTLRFTHTAGGLETSDGQAPIGFAIAGADSVFHWADATISGDRIILTSPEVDEPIAIRYAWADNPATNLYNSEGLPAVPFRTDKW